MDIRNYSLKLGLSICFFLSTILSFSQNENFISKEMVRYSSTCELQPELDKIIDSLKPEDQRLIFIINTFVKNDIYYISVTTSYGVEAKNDWIGFLEYRDKLFLLESIVDKGFFVKSGKDIIELNIEKKKESNDIVQAHLDNLPFWLLEYDKDRFHTKLFPY